MTTVEDDIRRVLSGTDPRSNSAEVEEGGVLLSLRASGVGGLRGRRGRREAPKVHERLPQGGEALVEG